MRTSFAQKNRVTAVSRQITTHCSSWLQLQEVGCLYANHLRRYSSNLHTLKEYFTARHIMSICNNNTDGYVSAENMHTDQEEYIGDLTGCVLRLRRRRSRRSTRSEWQCLHETWREHMSTLPCSTCFEAVIKLIEVKLIYYHADAALRRSVIALV